LVSIASPTPSLVETGFGEEGGGGVTGSSEARRKLKTKII